MLGSRRGVGSVWVAGRWPSFLSVPIHGERRPCVAAVRRRDSWVWSPRMRPAWCSPLSPSGVRRICVRTGAWWAYSEGNRMVARDLLVRRGCRCSRASSSRPFQSEYQRTFCPLGGFRAPGRRVTPRSGLRPGGTRYLVDSASSHMLVSKIKPCMSKYKHSIL